MVVEKRLVISVFQKDYELLSWNEQGEITKIEGMLTIAFLIVSSCSHKDNWKQLYCIIKIPYMVNMPTQQEILEENWQLRKEIDELKSRISKLELENNDLKSEIGVLKREKQGIIIAFSFIKGAYNESHRVGLEGNIKIELKTVEELLNEK